MPMKAMSAILHGMRRDSYCLEPETHPFQLHSITMTCITPQSGRIAMKRRGHRR